METYCQVSAVIRESRWSPFHRSRRTGAHSGKRQGSKVMHIQTSSAPDGTPTMGSYRRSRIMAAKAAEFHCNLVPNIFKRMSEDPGFSLVRVERKRPIEKTWQQYCHQHCPFEEIGERLYGLCRAPPPVGASPAGTAEEVQKDDG